MITLLFGLCIFLFVLAFVSLAAAFISIGEDYSFKFLMGFVALLLSGTVSMIFCGVLASNEYTAWANEKCGSLGGTIIYQYRSDDLCVTQDGRIIPDWETR